MKIGNVVNTPDGLGVIVAQDFHKYAKRYGVELAFPGMQGQVLYYYEKEIEVVL